MTGKQKYTKQEDSFIKECLIFDEDNGGWLVTGVPLKQKDFHSTPKGELEAAYNRVVKANKVISWMIEKK